MTSNIVSPFGVIIHTNPRRNWKCFREDWLDTAPTHVRIQRGDRGSGPPHPWKNTKIKHFLSILVRIPRKITKLPSQHSMLGHYRPASETAFGVSLAGRWWPDFSGIWIHPLAKKTFSKLDPLWKNFLDPRMKQISQQILEKLESRRTKLQLAMLYKIINKSSYILKSIWHQQKPEHWQSTQRSCDSTYLQVQLLSKDHTCVEFITSLSWWSPWFGIL